MTNLFEQFGVDPEEAAAYKLEELLQAGMDPADAMRATAEGINALARLEYIPTFEDDRDGDG